MGGGLRLPTLTFKGDNMATKYERLTRKLAAQGSANPKALAAWIGRKKLGKAEFQRRAAAGRRRHG